jgi:hypothetical protein
MPVMVDGKFLNPAMQPVVVPAQSEQDLFMSVGHDPEIGAGSLFSRFFAQESALARRGKAVD